MRYQQTIQHILMTLEIRACFLSMAVKKLI